MNEIKKGVDLPPYHDVLALPLDQPRGNPTGPGKSHANLGSFVFNRTWLHCNSRSKRHMNWSTVFSKVMPLLWLITAVVLSFTLLPKSFQPCCCVYFDPLRWIDSDSACNFRVDTIHTVSFDIIWTYLDIWLNMVDIIDIKPEKFTMAISGGMPPIGSFSLSQRWSS